MLTAVYGVVTSFPILLIARMLWGLSWSFIRQIGLMTVVDTTPPSMIGHRKWDSTTAYRASGRWRGNSLGGLAHDIIGFTLTLFLFAIISLIGTPLGWIARRAVLHENREKESVEDSGWVPKLMICGFVIGCVGPGILMSTLGVVLVKTVGTSLNLLGMVIGVATLNGLLLSSRWIADASRWSFSGPYQ